MLRLFNTIKPRINVHIGKLCTISPILLYCSTIKNVNSDNQSKMMIYNAPTHDVYHIEKWDVTKDFIKTCKTYDLNKIKEFHKNFIINYEKQLKLTSLDSPFNIITFYDRYWCQRITIDFDVYKQIMSHVFKEIMSSNVQVSEEIIRWFLSTNSIDKSYYYRIFNTVCCTGQLEKAQIMYAIHPIDFSYELNCDKSNKHTVDCFRSTLKDDALHVAKWLYSIDGHKYVPFGYSNIKENLYRNTTQYPNHYRKTYEWLLSLKEFTK